MGQGRILAGASRWLPLVMTVPASPALATATPGVTTDSAVYVERQATPAGRRLELAEALSPGDRVVTIVRWQRQRGQGGFTITNPLPRAISYQDSSLDEQEVSIDGGRNWGRLGQLRIGARLAGPEDVTHVRWRISERSSLAGRGQIAYSGIVR